MAKLVPSVCVCVCVCMCGQEGLALMEVSGPYGNQTEASRPTTIRLNQGNRPQALHGWGKGWDDTGEADQFPLRT